MRDTIQGLWVGEPLSNMEKLSMRSFLAHGHPYVLYTYDHVDGVPAGVEVRDGNEILSNKYVYKTGGWHNEAQVSWAGFSDLFRYKLLLEKGGWWVDTDFICNRPFDFETPYVFTGDDKGVAPGLVKVPSANTPMMQWIWAHAIRLYGPMMIWGGISSLLTHAVKKFGLGEYTLTDGNLFFPMVLEDLISPSVEAELRDVVNASYAVHGWSEGWRNAGVNKNAVFPASSFYVSQMYRYGVKP